MTTNDTSGKESIGVDKRTIRACEGCMVVVPERGGSGRFEVYSANDGVNKIYTVDLRAETCECPDHEHRGVECKHIKRVKLGLGILPVPAGVDLDEALIHDRRKYGVDPEPEPEPEPTEPKPKRARADGGAVLPPETRGERAEDGCPHDHPGCEGADTPGRPVLCWECWDVWAAPTEGRR